MAIIREGTIKEYTAPYEVMLNLYPDQFVEKKKKSEDSWIKINMDYFYTVAISQYNSQRKNIIANYQLLKGHLTPEDFYQSGPIQSFVDEVMASAELPAYVKHYPIINPPINGLVGEKSKRPDVSRAKCMDDDSKSEELEYYTQMYQQLVLQTAKEKVQKELLAKGVDTSNMEEFQQQVEQLTQDRVKEYMTSYTSAAEKWANLMLSALKVEFNTKELFEEGFRDLLICNREFFHIKKTGFTVRCENAKNVWYLTTPDKKYTKDAYASGVIEMMELSEILSEFDLPIEEIEHLRNYAMQAFFPYAQESNLVRKDHGGTGMDSIKYNAYDPLVLETRTSMEAQLQAENQQSLDAFLGNAAPSVGTFGMRFVVTTAYWLSKQKIGLLTYIDKDGNVQSTLVDEDYSDGDHPQQIALEWNYINQWYKGVKIGDDIYHVEPLEILDYNPIIGVTHEIKNTISTSLVDLMKPLQVLYNICMNQIYRYMEKEKGKVFVFNKRYIPLLKDADYQDSLEVWFRQMEEEGIAFVDDSATNTGSPTQFNQMTVHDMTLDQQMNQRLQLALALKNECWELVGMSKQRLGSVAASETATGTNTALTQSYAQTEPYFVQQEYLENQVLQAIIDVAQYIEGKKPESTVRYIDNEGGNKFITIQTESDLKNRDIKLFITSRAEDQRIFQKMQELAQPMLQNGADVYDIFTLYSTNSLRQGKEVFKELKERKQQMEQQNQQLQQQQQQAQEQQAQAAIQQKKDEHMADLEMEKYRIDTDANTRITVERIKEEIQIHKANQGSEPDYLAIYAQHAKDQEAIAQRDLKTMQLEMEKKKMEQQQSKDMNDHEMKKRKLDLEEKNITSREKIAKQSLEARKQQSKTK